MTHTLTQDIGETLRKRVPLRQELLALLNEKYGFRPADTERLERTGLQRIVDAFDFLHNNLPPAALVKAPADGEKSSQSLFSF